MGFWHLVLIGGLITWTGCVFLRAVAARTCQLRQQLVPPPEEPVQVVSATGQVPAAPPGPPSVAAVIGKPVSGSGKTPAGGSGKPSGNGKLHAGANGHAKVPVRRADR